MKRTLKIALFVIGFLLLIVAGAYAYINLALPNVGPAPEMTVEVTHERVERGRYLANHVMLCMDCHAERDWSLFAGPPTPGTEGAGGDIFDHSMGFPGVFISSNITPAGVGNWTDGELFRLITTGVKRDGTPIFPVMPYMNYGKMDEEDIKSVIAYIRTLEPVQTNHPASKADFPFSMILRTIPQKAKPTPIPPRTDQLAYGEYLVNAGACYDCHTAFEKGKFVGEFLAGGRSFQYPDGSIITSANLTPHETGLKNWTKEMFVSRFRAYADSAYVPATVQPGEFQTIMPWPMYGGMEVEDLEAIFAYLQTLKPVDNPVKLFVPAPEQKGDITSR
jgi:mono/diheme cytochrome c family protein